jgi:hypothetical protein
MRLNNVIHKREVRLVLGRGNLVSLRVFVRRR